MKLPFTADKNGAIFLATAALVVVGLVYLVRKQLADAADLAGGVVSGRNAITKGTVYEGDGIAGTLGAAANAASGGWLSDAGSWISGTFFDPNDDYDPNARAPTLQTRKQAIGDNFYASQVPQ